jgi:Fe-S cluster assembly ATPase SufC
MDEVFDSLDGDGVSAVSSVVEGLSTKRAVVLITHSEPLVRTLKAAQRLAL